jgi:hypothetical protein
VSLAILFTIYLVGWLSGIYSVLFYDLMQHLKGR